MMGGQSSHLPLKVNSGGSHAVIFAASILSAPMMLGQSEFVQNSKLLQPIMQALQPGYPWYELLYVLAIIFFAYFYVSIIMKPGRHCRQLSQVGLVLFPVSAPASAPRTSSTTSSPVSLWSARCT